MWLRFALIATLLVLGQDSALSAGKPELDWNRDIVGLYALHSNLPLIERNRCVGLLRSGLERGDKENALQRRLVKERCFDSFAGFVRTGLVEGMPAPKDTSAPKAWIVDGVIVIRISIFQKDVGVVLASALAGLPKSAVAEATDVVIDLIGDIGGYVSGLNDVLKLFAPEKGARYLQVVSRCTKDVPPFRVAPRRGLLAGKRYTFFVNGYTASASEWLIATMKYQWYPKSSTVIGVGAERTYGKALLQAYDEDLGFKVTCGEWQARGHPVQDVGIKSDRVLPATAACVSGDYRCAMNAIGLKTAATKVSAR